MPYEIVITQEAHQDLKGIATFYRKKILAEIDGQLQHQPAVPTRNRKKLGEVPADFEHVPPVWELRVGSYRVFYDVDETEQTVNVRAVRFKDQGQTTGDIIRERDDA
jgi:mRNA-degrading endonuclease RelE of RelBE toxin-antitoxin system